MTKSESVSSHSPCYVSLHAERYQSQLFQTLEAFFGFHLSELEVQGLAGKPAVQMHTIFYDVLRNCLGGNNNLVGQLLFFHTEQTNIPVMSMVPMPWGSKRSNAFFMSLICFSVSCTWVLSRPSFSIEPPEAAARREPEAWKIKCQATISLFQSSLQPLKKVKYFLHLNVQ